MIRVFAENTLHVVGFVIKQVSMTRQTTDQPTAQQSIRIPHSRIGVLADDNILY